MITVAVAGLGAIAQTVHLPLLRRRSDLFRISAVCDLSAVRVAATGEEWGVARRYTDLAAMLDDGGFDAVLLLTSGSHGEAAADALRRGYAVLSEKPLAYTRAEGEALARLGGPLMVGYMKQYDPAVTRARELLAEVGGPAAVRSAEVTVLHPRSSDQLAFARLPPPPADVGAETLAHPRAAEERLTRAVLGDAPEDARTLYLVTLTSICHDLSVLRLLTGAPAEVDHAEIWSGGPSVAFTGRLPEAGRFDVRWHYLDGYPVYRETIALHHDGGSLELVFPNPYLLNVAATLTVVEPGGRGGERRSRYGGVVSSFEEELVAFHALVTTGTPPLTGAAGGLQDIVTAQQVVRRYLEERALPCDGEVRQA